MPPQHGLGRLRHGYGGPRRSDAAKSGEPRRPASAKASAVRRSFSEGGSDTANSGESQRSSQSEVGPPASSSRAIVIVLDSVGVGELPDAATYGDQGSNTVGNIARRIRLHLPALRALGFDRLVDLSGPPVETAPQAAFGRMAELSPGKDSVTGHWELMGLVLDRPFPVFPSGFPRETIQEFERRIGRPTLGNLVASGTRIIDELGSRHLETGHPIVYTSADSVFQIAAHEDLIPPDELYRMCEAAYKIVVEGMGVGRVIARPFVGRSGRFTRTANRRDFAMPPTSGTLLDVLREAGLPVVAIGKIEDLFARRGISIAHHTASDDEGMDFIERAMSETRNGLIFANLVDFDTLYGHRNDVRGYAANLERFDARVSEVLGRLEPRDLFVVTADHGNDPTTPSTDHSREYVPLLVTGRRARAGVDLGTRRTFADLGQTLAEYFGVRALSNGTSFLSAIMPGPPTRQPRGGGVPGPPTRQPRGGGVPGRANERRQ